MNSFYQAIPGLIKYVAVIDRDNAPILFINLSENEKELDYQLLIYSSLDIFSYREQQKLAKQSAEDYLGLLMPCYEFEYDLGVYGFISNNGVRIAAIKKLESSIQETSSEIKLKSLSKEISVKLIKLLLNPFYDRKEFFGQDSTLREAFAKNIITLVKQFQII